MSAARWRFCSWCQKTALDAVLVRILEQGSAFGASLYACAACRRIFRLKPLSETPMPTGGSS